MIHRIISFQVIRHIDNMNYLSTAQVSFNRLFINSILYVVLRRR